MNVVYYAQRNGRIKIGTTGDIKGRLRKLGAIFLAAEPGSFKDERAIHERFAADRLESEWFRPSRPLLDYIASLPDIPERKPTPILMDTNAVAQVFRVCPVTVARWADEGLLPVFHTPGGRRRFRRADIEAWIANTYTGAAA